MADPKRYELVPTEAFKNDLRRLHEQALEKPGGPEGRVVRVALSALEDLQSGRENGTHTLNFMTTHADLSDCETTYIGPDPVRRPTHRLIWRELPPAGPGRLPRRQIIALGPRDGAEIYREVGRRLDRPIGVRLEDLPSTAERAAATRDVLKQVRKNVRGLGDAARRRPDEEISKDTPGHEL
jgi:hypothetical protein